MQELLPELEPRCANPECGGSLPSEARKTPKFCSQKCASRGRFLLEVERCQGLDSKVCRKCGEDKPLTAYRNPGMLWCQGCMKEKRRNQYQKRGGRDYVYGEHLVRSYGMNLEQYQERVEAQGGRCAICGDLPEGPQGRLHVDHDHRTGKVRELLCRPCNHALGNVKDDPSRLLAMLAYLARHGVVVEVGEVGGSSGVTAGSLL